MAAASINDAAIALLDANRPHEAAAAFRQVIGMDPNGASASAAYFNLGACHAIQSRTRRLHARCRYARASALGGLSAQGLQ